MLVKFAFAALPDSPANSLVCRGLEAIVRAVIYGPLAAGWKVQDPGGSRKPE